MKKHYEVFYLNNDILYRVQVPRCWQRGLQGWSLWEEAVLCQTQMVSASSKMGPAQDTAKPISKAGGASVEIYLRKDRGRRRVQKECEIAMEHQGQRTRCSMVGQALHHCQGTVWPMEDTHTHTHTLEHIQLPGGTVAYGLQKR